MNSFLLKLCLLAFASLGAGFAHSWIQGSTLATNLNEVPTIPATDTPTPQIKTPPTTDLAPVNPNIKTLNGQSKLIPTPPVKDNDIALADAFAAHAKQDGQTFFIDAREPNEFLAAHITGAMNLSPSMLARTVPQKALDNLRDPTLIILYCGGGDCHASEDVAIKLAQAIRKPAGGYKILHAGFPAWQEAKHPVESGPDPY